MDSLAREFDYPKHQVEAMMRRLYHLMRTQDVPGFAEAGIRLYFEGGQPAFAMSEGLSKAARGLEPTRYLMVIALLALTVRRVRVMERREGIRWLQTEADRAMAAWQAPPGLARTCRKGCAFCCHMMVMASPTEAELVVEAAGVAIDVKQARHLSTLHPTSYDQYTAGQTYETLRCPMLTADNTCAAYESRPLACRIHASVDDPALCDPVARPGAKLRHVMSFKAQILASVIYQLDGEDCASLGSLVAARLGFLEPHWRSHDLPLHT